MNTHLSPLELRGDEYSYPREVAMAFDLFVNAILSGWHHETLSSRAWRADVNGKRFGMLFRPLIDVLFAWQGHKQGHCRAVFERDLDRARRVVMEKEL